MRITVPGRELKSTFKDISGLLKKYEQARVIGISTNKETITFTVDTGTYYTRSITYMPIADTIEVQLTVMFADLSHFISGREDAYIELTEHYMLVRSHGSEMSMLVGDSIVAPYVPRGGTVVDLDFGKLRKAVKVFSSTQDLQKAFSREFAISFYGDTALMRAPTIWIQTASHGLNCVLSIEQMKSILMFQPEIVEVSDRLEFKKGSATLSIPRITPTEQNHMDMHKTGMQTIATLSIEGVVKELQEIKRVIGVAEADIRFMVAGFSVKIQKSGISLEKSYGENGDNLLYFRYPLDLFIMCLNLLGEVEEIRIMRKGGLVCLENSETTILLSVIA